MALDTHDIDRIDQTLAYVRGEVLAAMDKFPAFNSDHEGYAVLLEEVDEMWDEIKMNKPHAARTEALQVAAMAVRLIVDQQNRPPH